MALSTAGRVSKRILFGLNGVLLLAGVTMLFLGVGLRLNPGLSLLPDDVRGLFTAGVETLIVLGSVLLAAAAFGTFSARRENRRGLGVYAAFMALLAGVSLAFGMLTHYEREADKETLSGFYGAVYGLYRSGGEKDPAVTLALAIFHRTFRCCGEVGGLLESEEFRQETCLEPSGGGGDSGSAWAAVPACSVGIAHAVDTEALAVICIIPVAESVALAAMYFAVLLLIEIKKSRCRKMEW